MKTRIQGFKKDYELILKDISRIQDRLLTLGFACGDLPYHGYNSETMGNEYKILEDIKNSVLELKEKVERVV